MNIIIDSLEGKPYTFPGMDVVRKRLNVGDYSIEGFEDRFAVERKTLDDLASSMGAERDRFEAEIKRAQSLDEFVVVIEGQRSDVEDYVGQKRCPNYFSKMFPASIIGTVDKWPQRYDTLTFDWCDNRQTAKQETLHYLDSWYLKHGSDLY